MRQIIIFYLLLSFTFTFAQAVTGQTNGANFDDLEQVRNITTGSVSASVEQAEGTTETGTGWLGNIIGLTANFFKNIVIMTTFQFKLQGAPEVVNMFISGVLGIISLVWWSMVIKEVVPIVPGIG